MATVKLITDAEAEADPAVKAVFDDIRATRKTDFINNFWRGLANDPVTLKRTWDSLRAVMTGGVSVLMTVRVKVVSAVAESLSVAVMTTVWVPDAASVVSYSQVQVPSACFVTVPTEAVRATSSFPGSDQNPPLVTTSP